MDFLHALGQFGNLGCPVNSQRQPLVVVPASTPHPMQIGVHIDIRLALAALLGCTDVDNEDCVSNVDAPGHDVGAHQHIGLAVSELADDGLLLGVGHILLLALHVPFSSDAGLAYVLEVLGLLGGEVAGVGFELFVELVDVLYAVEEHEHLGLLVLLLAAVELFEDLFQDEIVELGFRVALSLNNFGVVLDPFQSDLLPSLLLDLLVDVELHAVLVNPLVEVHEMFLHRSRAGNNIRLPVLDYFEQLLQRLLVHVVDLVYLVNGHKLALVQLHVTARVPV